MDRLARRFFAALVLVMLAVPGLAQTKAVDPKASDHKAYVNDYMASEAVKLEAKWQAEIKPSKDPVAKLKANAAAAMARKDYQAARNLYIQAVILDPRDWLSWNQLGIATTYLKSDKYAENYAFQQSAEIAAYVGYQRAVNKADEATALDSLAQIYAVTYNQQRTALEILRAGLKGLDPSLTGEAFTAVRKTYADLRAEFGFRLLEYKLDSDSVTPRACFQFSEQLAGGKTDFTPYVTVTGVATPALSVTDRQLCVEGLEHGKSYHVVIRQGLPSTVGEDLLKSADYDLYVKDRRPSVHFTGRNYVLPRTGQEGLPVVTVNTEKVVIGVYRIGDRSLPTTVHSEDFLQQLQQYQADKIAEEKGVEVWTGKLSVKSQLNKDVVTAFPVMEAVGKLEPGIYVMVAGPDNGKGDDYNAKATQWFLVSDLGLTSFAGANDGLHVFVRSLSSAESLANIKVRLIAKNNEVLDTRTTDASGHVVFDAGLARGKGGMSPGMVIAEDGNGDYGFLDQQQNAFDLTDRGVKGRETPVGVDAFLYTERGVYRSGETVNVTTLLRDVKGKSVSGLPVTLVAERSDGVEYKREVVKDQGEGGRAWALPLVSGLPTGTWHVQAFTDPKLPAVGDVTFLVEDYVPERIDMKVTTSQTTLHPGEPMSLDVNANYLYGAPADGLAITGTQKIELAPQTTVPGLADWTVGLDDEPFEAIAKSIEGENTTDEKGHASVSVELPEGETTRPLQVSVTLQITENGGRAIERSVTLPILPKAPVLAVRSQSGDGLSAGDQAKFQVVYAAPDGTRLVKKGVKWTLSRIEHSYQWYNSEGRWDFELIKSVHRVADGTIDIAANKPADVANVVDWGQYRLDVLSDDPGRPHTSLTFSVGWQGSDKADTPDVLDVATDKTAYAAGEDVKVRLAPRFAGKATVAIVSDRIEAIQQLDIDKSGTTVTFPADANWGAGAYVVAMAYRPLDVAAHRMPGRAIGVGWFAVDRPARTLGVTLDVPKQMHPRATLTTHLKLAGLTAGETAHVTVSAVDVGILNLTHYETPNPEDHVFGQHMMSGDLRDLYGYLIDGMQGTRGAITAGGDSDAKQIQGPPDQAPLSRYSGVVAVAADGTADVDFDIPTFNGTVRVAAVAWTAGKLGHAEADVIVRDPIVVQATLPRFLTIGDQSRLQFNIDNVEGPAGNYAVDVDVHGPVTMAAGVMHPSIKLAAKGKAQLSLPFNATGLGTATFDIKVGAGAIAVSQSLSVPVQPATPPVYHRSIQPLAANGGAITISDDLTKEFIDGTGVVSLSVAPQTAFDVASLLKQLNRYPYGCTEQTVSVAMPLLYVNKLASSSSLDLDGGVDERIRKAIATVLSRQDTNGAFGLWRAGGDDDVWLDSFAADFLTRARERGFEVPQVAMSTALDRLRNFIVNTSEPKEADADKIGYAAYVLARNGRPIIGDLRYLADTKPDIFATPLARAQVGAALALLGDRGRAQPLFEAAFARLQTSGPTRVWRADYGTPLRDGAGLIALMAESGVQPALLQKVETYVGANRETVRYTSTQENSWMVMAAFATAREADQVALTVDGAPHPGAYYQTFKSSELAGHPVKVANNGPSPVRAVVNASGHPIQPEPALAQGFTVERTFHKLDGSTIDAKQVKQTDRLVVVLKVTEAKPDNGRLMLVDHLPAGFEIDNPNLVKSADLSGFDWLEQGKMDADHTEFRDDRFVATFNRAPSQSAFFYAAYMIRAVAPGKYILPPATIEDMYRPERFGRTAYGTVEVVAGK